MSPLAMAARIVDTGLLPEDAGEESGLTRIPFAEDIFELIGTWVTVAGTVLLAIGRSSAPQRLG